MLIFESCISTHHDRIHSKSNGFTVQYRFQYLKNVIVKCVGLLEWRFLDLWIGNVARLIECVLCFGGWLMNYLSPPGRWGWSNATLSDVSFCRRIHLQNLGNTCPKRITCDRHIVLRPFQFIRQTCVAFIHSFVHSFLHCRAVCCPLRFASSSSMQNTFAVHRRCFHPIFKRFLSSTLFHTLPTDQLWPRREWGHAAHWEAACN